MTLFKIRTVTYFVAALPDSDEGWQNEVRRAAHFLRRAQQLYECKGASVPTGMLGACASHDAPVASLAAASAPGRSLLPPTTQQRWHRALRSIASSKA